jgi:hypothetical protein
MLPLTILAANKLLNLLTSNDSLVQVVNQNAASAGMDFDPLSSSQIIGSFAGPEIGDLDLDLGYPRVSVYTTQVVNKQHEKFRQFSGVVQVVADVWASSSLEQRAETALHFYVEGIAALLRANIGDWGDGCRYPGTYEIQMQSPKIGGAGFVHMARVICNLEASFN